MSCCQIYRPQQSGILYRFLVVPHEEFRSPFPDRFDALPPEMGRRKEPITREGFGCPCKLNEKDDIFADCRLFLSGQHILPGETKQGGIRFSFDPAAPLFRAAGIFYLWGGRYHRQSHRSDGGGGGSSPPHQPPAHHLNVTRNRPL